jgi:hypothetical protein
MRGEFSAVGSLSTSDVVYTEGVVLGVLNVSVRFCELLPNTVPEVGLTATQDGSVEARVQLSGCPPVFVTETV